MGGTEATGIPMAVATGRWEEVVLRVLYWSVNRLEVTTVPC